MKSEIITSIKEEVFKAFKAEKMNYELLGNGDTHIHWHLFPRKKGDTPKKGPVWWLPLEKMCSDSNRPNEKELKEMVEILKKEIKKLLAK
ncbi:MAG: HIT family protein [Clostridium sp.]